MVLVPRGAYYVAHAIEPYTYTSDAASDICTAQFIILLYTFMGAFSNFTLGHMRYGNIKKNESLE